MQMETQTPALDDNEEHFIGQGSHDEGDDDRINTVENRNSQIRQNFSIASGSDSDRQKHDQESSNHSEQSPTINNGNVPMGNQRANDIAVNKSGEKEGSNLADFKNGTQFKYENMQMTQQREGADSPRHTHLQRQTTHKHVEFQDQKNVFMVKIEQGSNNSKGNDTDPGAASQQPQSRQKEAMTGLSVYVQNNIALMNQTMQSAVESQGRVKEPRYNGGSITIATHPLNKDLEVSKTTMSLVSPTAVGRPSFGGMNVLSPQQARRKQQPEQLLTNQVTIDAKNFAADQDMMSPTLRGAKLNRGHQANVRAIKGVEQKNPKRYNGGGNFSSHIPQLSLVPTQLVSPGRKPAHLHSNPGKVEQPDAFENILSGTQMAINPTPVIKYLSQHRQQQAKKSVANSPTRIFAKDSLKGIVTITQRTGAAHQDFQVDQMSRETPDMIEPLKINKPLYITHNTSASRLPDLSSQSNWSRSPKNSTKKLSAKKGFYDQSNKRKQKLVNTQLSKDLIDVINDQQSEEQYSRQQTTPMQVIEENKRKSGITFYDESEISRPREDSPIKNIGTLAMNESPIKVVANQKDEMSPTKHTVLSSKQLSSPALDNYKNNLHQFHNNHKLNVQASEQELMEILPELAHQRSGGIQGYRANIPRVDMMIDENKIGKNPPASGIRIFEEHQNSNKTRQSNKSLSPKNRSLGQQLSQRDDHLSQEGRQSNDASGLDRHSEGSAKGGGGANSSDKPKPKYLSQNNSQNRLSFLDAQLNYQVAPQQQRVPSVNQMKVHKNGDNSGGLNMQRIDSRSTLPIDLGKTMNTFNGKKTNMNTTAVVENTRRTSRMTLSPKPVIPDLSMAIKTSKINSIDHSRTMNNVLRQRKLTVQVEQNKQALRNQNIENQGNTQLMFDMHHNTPDPSKTKKIVNRKNTEVLGHAFGSPNNKSSRTLQKVLDLSDTLNRTIHKNETLKHVNEASQASILDQINQVENSVYMNEAGGLVTVPQVQSEAYSAILEDAVTLEQRESGLARYPDQPTMRITTKSKFNITNNMMSLRLMKPKESSVFPLEAPPIMRTSSRFNVTQFKQQMQMVDTNVKFNMSFITSPKQVQHPPTTMQTSDIKVKINTRHNRPNAKVTGFQHNMTIAETIKEVKERHKYAGTPRLDAQYSNTMSGTKTGPLSPARTRSYDLRLKRHSNPFGSGANMSMMSDVTKRFKNISDREASPNHISDKVYANAQNTSQYNNSYTYVSTSAKKNALKKMSMSQNSGDNEMKQIAKKYEQTKVSTLERPTQLEAGGEGSPMLSLLPPLRTREISPRFNYTVGKGIKLQQQSQVQLKTQQDLDEKAEKARRKGKNKSSGKKGTHHIPTTKILMSTEEQLLNRYGKREKGFINQPVMIKAVSGGSLHEDREGNSPSPSYDGLPLFRDQTLEIQYEQSNNGSTPLQTRGPLDEYRDVFLDKREAEEFARMNNVLNAFHISDQNLDYKLAQMASKAHRDVVIPLEQVKETAPIVYERRQLNRDGTWKDSRYGSFKSKMQGLGEKEPGFLFLEYASKNFKNPQLGGMLKNQTMVGSPNVAQAHQMSYEHYQDMTDEGTSTKKRGVFKSTNKTRNKRPYNHHSQGYQIDEKFSLKVQKKPMHGLQHIKVQQADGPGGIKLYSIKVQQKSPRLVPNERMKDSIEVDRTATLARRKGKGDTLNETFRFLDSTQDELMSPMASNLRLTQAANKFHMVTPGPIDQVMKSQESSHSADPREGEEGLNPNNGGHSTLMEKARGVEMTSPVVQ